MDVSSSLQLVTMVRMTFDLALFGALSLCCLASKAPKQTTATETRSGVTYQLAPGQHMNFVFNTHQECTKYYLESSISVRNGAVADACSSRFMKIAPATSQSSGLRVRTLNAQNAAPFLSICYQSSCGYGSGLKTSDVKMTTTQFTGTTLQLLYKDLAKCKADYIAMTQGYGGHRCPITSACKGVVTGINSVPVRFSIDVSTYKVGSSEDCWISHLTGFDNMAIVKKNDAAVTKEHTTATASGVKYQLAPGNYMNFYFSRRQDCAKYYLENLGSVRNGAVADACSSIALTIAPTRSQSSGLRVTTRNAQNAAPFLSICDKSYCGYGSGLKTSDVKVRTTQLPGTLVLSYKDVDACKKDFTNMAQPYGGHQCQITSACKAIVSGIDVGGNFRSIRTNIHYSINVATGPYSQYGDSCWISKLTGFNSMVVGADDPFDNNGGDVVVVKG